MGKYFGTDGFRGEANVSLTATHAYKIGKYLGYHFGKGARIAIGKDTRKSSYMLEYAVAAGICASGADAYLLHVTTTPSVSYVTRTEDFACGVMISASHNPYTDNGIKIINSGGEKASDALTDKIEEYLDAPEDSIPFATGAEIGRTVDYVLGRNRYTGYLISLSRHSYKGLRIGLDGANGSAWMLAKSVFDTLGAKTYVLGCEPNGTNINLGVGSTHIGALSELVVKEGLDIGFAFDGDADRCLAVDERGELIRGENILYFMAKHLLTEGKLQKNTVVTTVMSNVGLEKALKKLGIELSVSDVGDRFVWERMTGIGASLGGEESGHIIFSSYATTGDGLITAIKITEALIESKDKASRLSDGLTLFPQLTRNIRTRKKDEVIACENVRMALEKAERTLSGEGRILLRKSGTEPVVRIMAEAKTKELCEAAVSSITEAIPAELIDV